MSLSDCPKCWDTPCECGHMYKDWTRERLDALIATLGRVLDGSYQQGQATGEAAIRKMEESE